ncbi:NAD(+) synthase [Lentibacillus amyloliquefaciens]|uniref:NH(3)-dependent NAD(+) synthetase n=1 Tax=Lentibacillus amyloliquefaciens TaxID=1472767 RepID=A0A0U3W4S7_9BACI|nr:NAD(+) synthase [Lentibacillus amyloliquefaciens]ALX48194.1 NAD(+) synthetase [Lentibacillus amyloliquefaciens]
MQKIVDEIVKWLQERVEEAGLNGLLVGVSGGLDSAVVAHLIQRAFPDNSLGVMLPLNTKLRDMDHANKVIERSGINDVTIDLTEPHEAMYSSISKQLKQGNAFNEESDQLAGANLRARLRMSTLYTLSAHYNYLVVGTDNVSEWYTGYFTKYGDGGVDILPLLEFTKQEVREMGEFLGVHPDILGKKPSADLWEGQTDEDEMGTTYDKIDAYLKGEEIPEEDKKIIEDMHKRTTHKREPLPHFHRS